jgi:hypothetical protein
MHSGTSRFRASVLAVNHWVRGSNPHGGVEKPVFGQAFLLAYKADSKGFCGPPTNGRKRGHGWPRKGRTPAWRKAAWMPPTGRRIRAGEFEKPVFGQAFLLAYKADSKGFCGPENRKVRRANVHGSTFSKNPGLE